MQPTMDDLKLRRDGRLAYGLPLRTLEEPLSYVGRKCCGCVVAWCSARLSSRERAAELRQWKRLGLTVERATVEDAKTLLRECVCGEREG